MRRQVEIHGSRTGIQRFALAGLCLLWLPAPALLAQSRPYIGYVYPAGGQQGTTFRVKLGGQNLDDVHAVLITGAGVSASVVEYHRRLNNQEIQLLNEQLRELKRATSGPANSMAPMMAADSTMMMSSSSGESGKGNPAAGLLGRLEKRTREYVQTPACASLASLATVEVAIAPEAAPGPRELRLATPRGVSNPLVFHVGQVPEYVRPPMHTAPQQILGKEAQALRKRPTNEVELQVTLPCTVNGQIACGEVNRYRFTARKGQRLLMSTQARQLIPFIADAVPGWFQPVLTLHDAQGRELAFADDYRFKPDPVILFEVPQDGDYVLAITDAIYRGREDFVYRITLGELPFVTSIFPLGARTGAEFNPKLQGWNLAKPTLTLAGETLEAAKGLAESADRPGQQSLVAHCAGFVSNPVPFVRDDLPEAFDQEPNNTPAGAQKVRLPILVNGRIDRPGDWDVFQFTGKSNDLIALEVSARRLDSPLDSLLKLTDASGQILAFNDDREDLGAGVNTHHADAYCLARLPASGTYYVHLGDTARQGGEAYGYRLRISAARPDFALRVVPSSLSLRSKSTATVTVYAQRQDGFSGPIRLGLQDPPPGFSAAPVTLSATQTMGRLTIKTDWVSTRAPARLVVVGSAKVGEKTLTREAVPAEDRMQAFLWRHLVPASDLLALVFDPSFQPPPARVAPVRPPSPAAPTIVAATNAVTSTNTTAAAKPKFTKQQIAGRLRQLKLLYEEGLLTDDFYGGKVAECEAAQ
jgi:hypothetical protein